MLKDGLTADLVVLDMNMPGMDGAKALSGIRNLLPELPVILVTGRVDQKALDILDSNPHMSLLAKPFTQVELAKKIAEIFMGK